MKKRTLQDKIYHIIYKTDTPFAKLFDLILLVVILLSVVFVMLESVDFIDAKYHYFFKTAEWVITILFSVEYILRIISHKKPRRYIFSFFGIIDFVSTIPMYISIFLSGSHMLIILRLLRLFRIFRILKLVQFMGEANHLARALKSSRRKIMVFIYTVVILALILGTIMYLIEGKENGFTSIPRSIYWTIVTLTTVGYGDIAPKTIIGQAIATVIMILGYGIIAVPTGIVTAELGKTNKPQGTLKCKACNGVFDNPEAKFCCNCGKKI